MSNHFKIDDGKLICNCGMIMVLKDGQEVCPTQIPWSEHTMLERYVFELIPHKMYPRDHPKYREIKVNEMPIIGRLDFFLREAIGKTDDIHVPMCSHHAIVNRELPEHFCRVCNKDLSKVGLRVNDYLVLRHPQCTKPICGDCAQNNPDEFYKAFRLGYEKYKMMKQILGSRYKE